MPQLVQELSNTRNSFPVFLGVFRIARWLQSWALHLQSKEEIGKDDASVFCFLVCLFVLVFGGKNCHANFLVDFLLHFTSQDCATRPFPGAKEPERAQYLRL